MKFREEIDYFAQAMEYKLMKNDHKGGWGDKDQKWLIEKLKEEVVELVEALETGNDFFVVLEAADVANYAMMLAWNLTRGKKNDGNIMPTPRPGREALAHGRIVTEPKHR